MDEFDQFESYDADAAEARAKAGGRIPPGFHHAKLIGAKRITSAQKQTPGWELTFEVTAGPFKGSEVTDKIWVTDNQMMRDNLAHFGKRLGLLVKTKDGKGLAKVEGKQDLSDCLDAKCIIEVTYEPDQNDPSKKWVRIPMFGVHYHDDKDALAKVGKPVPEKSAAPAGNKAATAEPSANGKAKPKGVNKGEL